MITLIKKDLFTATGSLAHCVSEDLHMGKGIAVEFKQRFGNVDYLKSQNSTPGGLAILPYNKDFIYYLVTKEKYYGKPSYETVQSSLLLMKQHAVNNQVSTINMPKIGCGLDRLEWSKVEKMLMGIFKDTEIRINVYYI
jgi:O-acetyl-ADP-ribose deacetylase (regulator of RNase III)